MEVKCAWSVARVLRDSLGTFRDGMLGELTGQEQADGGLNFAGRKRLLFVVSHKLGGLTTDLLEQIVDERVHN